MADALDFLSGVGETVVDALAERGGAGGAILGGALQRIANTQGYQDRVNREQFGRENIDFERKKIADYNANAPTREQARQEYMNEAPMRASLSMLAQQNAEDKIFNNSMNTLRQSDKTTFASTIPGFSDQPEKEQDIIVDGAYAQAGREFRTLGRLWDMANKGDTSASRLLENKIKNAGGEYTTNDKGEKVVNIWGKSFIATPENAIKIGMDIQNKTMEDAKVRTMLYHGVSDAGNPAGQVYSEYIKDLSKYNGDKPAEATQYAKNLFNGMSEGDRAKLVLDKTLDNYFSDNVTSTEKTKGLEQGLFFAKRLGFKVDGNEPETAKIISPDGEVMNLVQFRDYIKERNTGRALLDQQLGGMKQDWEEKEQLRKLRIEEHQKKVMSGSFGSGGGEPSPMEPEYKRLDKGAEDLMKAAPDLVSEIQAGIDKYNKKNPKKMIDTQTAKRVMGAAHVEAEMKSGGDIEAYKNALADNLQEELAGYGINIDRNKNFGFDEKMHETKITENEKKKRANEKRLAELEKEPDTIDQYSDNPFSIYQSPTTPLTTTAKSRKIAQVRNSNSAIDNDTAERKNKLVLLKQYKEQQEKASTEAAEKKKQLNALLGI